jgi:hypothetical protein
MEGCQYRTSKQRIVVKDYLNRTRLAMQIYGVVSGFRCQVSEMIELNTETSIRPEY